MAGMAAEERRDKAGRYLELVGLNSYGDYLPHRLSGGIFTELKSSLPRPRSGPVTRTADEFWELKKVLIKHITDVHN